MFLIRSNMETQLARKNLQQMHREGQRWTDDRPGMTLRLPIDLREAVTEESRVKGDLARIVLFALSHVEREKVEVMQTRKAGMELTNPQLLHVGAEARLKLKDWAEAEGVSVNAIVVSVLEEFFKRLKKSKALREELRLEIRAHRGLCRAELLPACRPIHRIGLPRSEETLTGELRGGDGVHEKVSVDLGLRKSRPVSYFLSTPHDQDQASNYDSLQIN